MRRNTRRKLKAYLKPHTNDDGATDDTTDTTDDGGNCKHKPCNDDNGDDLKDDTVSKTDDGSCKHKPCSNDDIYYYNSSIPTPLPSFSPTISSKTTDDYIYIGSGM